MSEQEWMRLHPLTPLLRGGAVFLALLLGAGQQSVRNGDTSTALVYLALATPFAALAGYVSWRTTRYRLEAAELQITTGILRKRDRRVPLARVQSIELVRPVLARVFGLAELRLEVVGGKDSEARLAYLSEGDATTLRASLLSLAAGRPAPEEQPVEATLVVVPSGDLALSVLLGAPLMVMAATPVVLLLTAAIDVGAAGALFVAAFPVFLTVAGIAVRRVITEYGFSVAEVPEGLRLRQGLLDRRTQTIPTGRVQTIRIREPLLWRWKDWVRVEVDVAGFGAQEGTSSALLPVAPRAFAYALVTRVLGADLPPTLLGVPEAARWRAPLSRRRLQVAADSRHVVARSGVLTTTTDIVPMTKIQSLRLTSGPWQRSLGLASVHVDNAGRRLSGAVLAHRSAAEAERMLASLTARARAARLKA